MDARLALGVQPLQIPDQAAGYQKALTMAALLGQGDLQKLQIAHATRENAKAQRYDDIARNSKTMDEFLSNYEREDPVAASTLRIKMNKDRMEGMKTEGDVLEQQSKLAQGLTAGFLSLKPEQQEAAFPMFTAEWKRNKLPEGNGIPAQWDPGMLPNLQMIAQRGLSSKDSAERTAHRDASMPPGQPTTMGAYTAPTPVTPQDVVDPASGAQIRPMATQQPQGTAIAQNQAPTVEVTAKKGSLSPEEMRARAEFAESKNTPEGSKIAKDWYERANQLEQRIQEDQKIGNDKSRHDAELIEIADASSPSGTRMVPRSEAVNKPGSKKLGATQVNVGMNATDASKAELLNQGISDMAEFKGMLIGADGKINRQIITGMNIPGMAGIPYTDSRIAHSLISNAVEAKLRAESGAAVPKEEVSRMAARFIPSPLDSDEAIMSKMRRMEAFLRGSFGRIKGAGEPDTPKVDNPGRRASDKAPPKTVKWEDLQ